MHVLEEMEKSDADNSCLFPVSKWSFLNYLVGVRQKGGGGWGEAGITRATDVAKASSA